jgi:MYXO-CTERM domain-containing protein
MESDFSRSGYASDEEAISVLVSHEYFHAVQAAYTRELATWFSEGTATWFEEHHNPDQRDFERLSNEYFESSDRSLNSRSQGPFDSFSYGASLFFWYIDLNFDSGVIQDAFVEISKGVDEAEALDTSLKSRDSSLVEVFTGFAIWNMFTGSRATDEGYGASALYDEVEVLELDASGGANWDVAVDGLSAAYAKLTLSGSARVSLIPIDGAAAPVVTWAKSPSDSVTIDEEGLVITDETIFLVVSNGDPNAEQAVRVAIRNVDPDAGGDEGNELEEPNGSTSEGSSEGCQSVRTRASGSLPWGVLMLALGLVWRRRR